MPEPFGGNAKVGQSVLHTLEKRAVDWAVPRVPASISTVHLTLATIPISLGIILVSWFAKDDFRWLWSVSILIFLQWVTDSLDGAVGRYRNTGLIKWGYYMDHFLDYIFLCSILIGYSLMLPDSYKYLQFFLLAIFGAFMVNSFLAFAASNKFRISYLGIGPTEVRLMFIAVNTLLIFLGKTHLAGALPYVLVASVFGLCVVVYRTQKELWQIDMEAKRGK
jgi:phosphatidylglycerophosphate synthase